jgi:peptide/nickel transport system ATP-binding protein
VLLADEPTTALDVTVQIQILLLLRELQRELGMAVIFVTHDVGAAVEVSDRLAVMYAGRFVESGNVRDVLQRHAHPYTEGLLAANLHGAEPGTRLATIPGSPPNLAALSKGCDFVPRCRHAMDRCINTDPPEVPGGEGHVARCLRVEEGLDAFVGPVLATGK